MQTMLDDLPLEFGFFLCPSPERGPETMHRQGRVARDLFQMLGAPRPMKMGTIASPWRYDVVARCALQWGNLRRAAILCYAL
jgi:hypothetical protein